MSVYRRPPSSDSFRNYPIGTGIQGAIDARAAEIAAYNERAISEIFEGDGVVDLTCIDGVWQEPPK